MRVQSEYEVESLFIEKLTNMGYEYVDLKNYDDVLTNFREMLCKVNKDELMENKNEAFLSNAEFERIIQRLEGHTIYESAKILREEYPLLLDNGETAYIKFFANDYNNNTYQVAHQITMDKAHKDDVLYKNRYDVTVLINGLPLVQIELKRPGVEINEAINQINRYRRFSFKGLFRYIQIFVVSNSVQTKYFANTNEMTPDGTPQNILKSLAFYWTDDNNKRINELMNFTQDFMRKSKLTDILSDYFVIKETEPILMVMRPYQIYAVQKAYQRVVDSGMNGYIFHTTGSGKTLTSYKLAKLLQNNRSVDKVFFLIDRKDLDDQTVDEYNSFEPGCVDNTDNTKALVATLEDTSKKLIVTTIQKMASALRNEKYSDILDKYKNKKVVFIIDECHRSQFGKMNSAIKKHFQKACYVGFTGTPIMKENKTPDGRTTADVFYAGEQLNACIHKYMIKEAIADGNVLRFSVEYMKSITANHLPDPGIDPKKLDDPEYCKVHNIDIDNLYHQKERIENISNDILEHLEQHTHPVGKDVYTAIFAVDKIQTLMEYYRYMKEHNPKNYKIATIFTYGANEDMDEGQDEHSCQYLEECMKDYNEMFGTDFDLSKFDAYRKDISKRLKQKSLPQVDLLLVVNMFLTGFDSKATNTLILDKSLVWHSLVQAYSRTNRVDKKTKQFGQIITYRNIKKAQDDALRLYSGDNNPDEFLLQSYDYYVAQYRIFAEKVIKIAETPEEAGYLQSEDEKKQFVLAFRSLAGVLNTLKTFSKFDWAQLDMFMDEATYEAYKSWYLTFYDELKDPKNPRESILVDVDFDIELIRTDKINVVYILNLLKDVNRKDKQKMQESIDLILREIERSDNEKMRYKKDIMKEFINTKFFELDPDADIIEAYTEYEKQIMQRDIEEYAHAHNMRFELVSEILNQYFVEPKMLTKEYLREKFDELGYGLLALTRAINDMMLFVQNMYDKFTAEGK